MRVPSRRMPKIEINHRSLVARILIWFVLLFKWFMYLLKIVIGFIKYPWTTTVVLTSAAALRIWFHRRSVMQIRCIYEERPGESISTFARSFERYKIDTWVIRAVYEDMQLGFNGKLGPLPLRRTDNIRDIWLQELLEIDSLAKRCSRSLERVEGEIDLEELETVENLVHFLNDLPKIEAA